MKMIASGLVAAALVLAPLAGRADDGPKAKKPRLDLRATPRFAFSPVTILLTAELMGGDDVEDYYCPELEWDWDDGGKSVHEADCPPYEPGKSTIERRFTAEHEYRVSSVYNVKVTMRRGNRALASQSVRVTVRPGAGERTIEDPGQ